MNPIDESLKKLLEEAIGFPVDIYDEHRTGEKVFNVRLSVGRPDQGITRMADLVVNQLLNSNLFQKKILGMKEEYSKLFDENESLKKYKTFYDLYKELKQ